jgi:hypothetical protein
MNIACLFLVTTLTFAEEIKSAPLIHTLPADGAWSAFQVAIDVEGRTVPATWTIRSVGRVMHQDKPCRCLEMELKCDDGPQQIIVYNLENTTWRLIIPEDEFGEGKDPVAHVVKSWQQIGKSDPVLQPSIANADPMFAAILKGPAGKLKVEDAKEKIQWQQGTLECRVLSGSQEIEFAGANLTITSRIFQNSDVPFSMAGMRKELKATVGGMDYEVRIKATLRDHGKDAKPKFPQLVP